MSQLKKKISLYSKNAADILKKLDGLTGLIYLNDNNNPTIGFLPQDYIIIQNENYLEFERQNFNEYKNRSKSNQLLNFIQFKENNLSKDIKSTTSFIGGYIGFISYDFSAHQFINGQNHIQPSLFLGQYRSFLKYIDNDWYFFSDEENAIDLFSYIKNKIENFGSNNSKNTFELKTTIQPRWSKKQYFDAFYKIQEYIKAGDCYQINLTQEFKAKFSGSLLNKAKDLWQLTNAPYAGYLKLDDFELLSCSPELFIEFNQNKQIKTRPIKGTMPRYENAEKDFISKQTLKNSQKDQAENVMIVDLLRNDLSIYANTGSVKTTKLFEIESFNQVHHMVSEIVATLKDDINPMQMLLSALPGGSITGAPKIRAMQIIEELEEASRGAYCGTLGYFNFDGTGRWNILIRSFQQYQNQLSLWAGGGITIASNAEAEYQESLDKVSAMLNLMNSTAE
ncbi:MULTISPECIES: anthranilate synthase component I family protein [Acinetobacter]|jgi:para-aminobenzoate synthetase component 1|uniref:Anthranilate synthase component I family protein n=2 Tax=Acinetobacter pittii TaxID=48296 RepID=A0AAE9M731_ACIPI|nr:MULTISPECIES: anthranilate synthase component I family protein [Acinetobacter calcoaceticus/baumannii complex]AZP30652.1 anthranilate synthase component I family protein [Acinetobacter pittii]EXE26418.1 chorismate binding enzyme family protein [Acinetobacter sp. 907131]EXS16044.1 chorismate binding enzyme family protein [Acinetobacter sp. 883425]MBK0411163.1 anthranilate synthase component I family protein [Acinetobacter pittii]MBK1417230.1 anthranilate synthase component I family protein [